MAAGAHSVAVDAPGLDLGTTPPLQGLVDAEDQRAVAAVQVLKQQRQSARTWVIIEFTGDRGTFATRTPDILADPKRCDMTTTKTTGFRLPDPPEREPDEMTSTKHLAMTGSMHHLLRHLGSPDTTLVSAELYITQVPHPGRGGRRRSPDLLVAFDADPELYFGSNGYVISEQGKPPDFVLEVASASTATEDLGVKREVYAAFGIPEYWRFDETGEHYGDRLAGERLVDGVYEPIEVANLAGGILQGSSDVLGLDLRWHDGRLEWYDPATGRHIATFDDERAARIQAETRVESAEARADTAEARSRELEEELRRLRGE